MAGVITALLAATSALTATGGLPGVGGRLSLVRASRRYASGGGVRLRAEDDWPDAPPQSYGEESRKYRRTVYAHADWLRHRSSSRLFRGLRTMFISGVVRALWLEVFTIFAVSTGLVAWNHQGALGHLSLLPAWAQCLQLPVLPFNLSSPVLGLLLVFRTNTSYARWLEARIIWGRVAAHASNMLRQAIAWTERADAGGSPRTAERMGELDGLALSLRLFQRALCAAMRGVEYAAEFRSWVRLNLEPADSMRLLRAAPAERPWVALSIVTCHLEQMKMDPKRAVEIDKSLVLLSECAQSCERIFTAPIPLVYTRLTARFLSAWLLCLPFGLWACMSTTWHHVGTIPACTLIAIFFMGIEELAIQLEEPFSIMPLEAMCTSVDKTLKSLLETDPYRVVAAPPAATS